MKPGVRAGVMVLQATIGVLSMIYMVKAAGAADPEDVGVIGWAFLMGILLLFSITGLFMAYNNLKKLIQEGEEWKQSRSRSGIKNSRQRMG